MDFEDYTERMFVITHTHIHTLTHTHSHTHSHTHIQTFFVREWLIT